MYKQESAAIYGCALLLVLFVWTKPEAVHVKSRDTA